MSLSLYDLFVTMGPFAKFIVVVLAVMSVISWANAVQKLVQIIRSERQTRKFAPEFSRFLQEEQLRRDQARGESEPEPRGARGGRGALRGEAAAARSRDHHRGRHQLSGARGGARDSHRR